MNTKMSFICCLFVILVMALPMSVPADGDGELDIGATVYPDYYEEPPANIIGLWTVTEPSGFDEDYCYVSVGIGPAMGNPIWFHTGYYEVGVGGGGDVTVTCSMIYGSFDYDWDWTEEDSPPFDTYGNGEYKATVYVEVWDEFPFDYKVWDYKTTNTFEIAES
jgi:hypothetical protein